MRQNLNVLLGIFSFHDFFQVEFGHAKLTRGIQPRFWQRDAAPLQLPSNPTAVPCVLPDPAGKCQHFQQRLMSLHLVNARCVYCAYDRDWLAPHFRDAYDDLRLTDIFAQDLVCLLLGLLRSQPGYMHASAEWHFYVAVAVNAHGLIGEISQFRSGNLQLVIGTQQVCGANLAATLRLHIVGLRGRRNLRPGIGAKKENCQANQNSFGNHDCSLSESPVYLDGYDLEIYPELESAIVWLTLEGIAGEDVSNAAT